MPALTLLATGLLLTSDPAAESLRAAARAWEAHDRAELARQSLEKLAALRAVRAEDLLLLGEIDLRQSDLAAARAVLERLEQSFAGSNEARTLATELRVVTADRVAMAAVRRQVETGHTVGVVDALRRLFPDGVPNGILGIEYCEIVASVPGGWEIAEAGLIDLVRRHPRDVRYTVALARHLTRRASTARLAVRLLEPLKGRSDVRTSDLNDALNRAQAALAAAPADTVEQDMPLLEAWLSPAPSSPAREPRPPESASPEPATAPDAPTAPTVSADPAPVAATTAATDPAPASVWDLYRAARTARASGDRAATDAAIGRLEARVADDDDAAFARALVAESAGDADGAGAWLARLPASASGAGIDALRARLAAAPTPVLPADVPIGRGEPDLWSGSVSFTHKPGDSGVSALSTVTVPLEWRHTLPDRSSLGLMAEAVSLDAGPLPTDPAALGGFGSVVVNGLGSSGGRSTHTAGVALGMAWHRGDLVADVGTTPLGFALTRLVGGVRYAPTVGPLDTQIEAFRRPVTSSLLSFAGRVDPGTGRLWGGVTESGVAARVGDYRADRSLALAVRATTLEGTGVAHNTRLVARASGDRSLTSVAGGPLSVGASLSFEAYDRNLLGYTIGNGGYFSPPSYTALALPVEWARRRQDLAVKMRFAPTVTHRHDATAPWYPLDPALTAAATAAGLVPRSTGGTADAVSAAIAVSAEWRASGGVWGVAFAHDRADYYRPVSFSVYYRPGVTPGERGPVQPYLDY